MPGSVAASPPRGDGKEKKRSKKDKKKEKKERGTLDGRQAKKAVAKDLSALFGGTGLDPLVKVRKRVLSRAQKFATKRSKQRKTSTSSSSSSSSSTVSLVEGAGMDGVFTTETMTRGVAERFPGALALETIATMRRSLLTTAGEEEEEASIKPIAVLYYRNQLARRSTGAQGRELLNLSTALDHLLRGRVAMAADVLCQRIKAQESVLQGTHWSIAQRFELPQAEEATLVAQTELQLARKANYEESRTRWLSQNSSASGKKGEAKGKQKGVKGERADWGKDGRKEEARKDKGKGTEKKQ